MRVKVYHAYVLVLFGKRPHVGIRNGVVAAEHYWYAVLLQHLLDFLRHPLVGLYDIAGGDHHVPIVHRPEGSERIRARLYVEPFVRRGGNRRGCAYGPGTIPRPGTNSCPKVEGLTHDSHVRASLLELAVILYPREVKKRVDPHERRNVGAAIVVPVKLHSHLYSEYAVGHLLIKSVSTIPSAGTAGILLRCKKHSPRTLHFGRCLSQIKNARALPFNSS